MNFKSYYALDGFEYIHPKMREIALDLDKFCDDCNEEMVITETMTTLEHDLNVGRKTETHRTGRAIDIRFKDWDGIFLKEFIRYCNVKYGELGAISKKDKKKHFVVIEKDHLHLQLNRSFSII